MTSRRQDENTTGVLNRRVAGSTHLHPHSLLSKKTAVNENSLSKAKTPSAKAPIGKGPSNLPLGGKSKIAEGDKTSVSGEGTKPSTSTTRRAPLASKAGPTPAPRPILGSKTSSSHQSINVPTTSIPRSSAKTFKLQSKPAIPSHVVGNGTPTLSRSRVGASTPKTSRPLKKALNVYTPAPAAPTVPSQGSSKLRSLAIDEDDDVEYMPPAVQEMVYEPACLMQNEKSKNEDDSFSPSPNTNAKQSEPVLDLDLNLEMQDDNLQRSEVDLDSSLTFDVPDQVDDFLFDI